MSSYPIATASTDAATADLDKRMDALLVSIRKCTTPMQLSAIERQFAALARQKQRLQMGG